jgi:hypothetical protein
VNSPPHQVHGHTRASRQTEQHFVCLTFSSSLIKRLESSVYNFNVCQTYLHFIRLKLAALLAAKSSAD